MKPKRKLSDKQLASLRANGAKPCNQRAKKSGTRSDVTLRPLREHFVGMLRERYPELDEIRLTLLADRLARVSVGSAWLDEQGNVVRNRQGAVYDVANQVEKWASRAEQILAEIDRERAAKTSLDLAAHWATSDADQEQEADDG